MNTDLASAIATERHHQFVVEADEYRRSHRTPDRKRTRLGRMAALIKDLASASL